MADTRLSTVKRQSSWTAHWPKDSAKEPAADGLIITCSRELIPRLLWLTFLTRLLVENPHFNLLLDGWSLQFHLIVLMSPRGHIDAGTWKTEECCPRH